MLNTDTKLFFLNPRSRLRGFYGLLDFYKQAHDKKLNREFEKGEVEYITLPVSSFVDSFFREW